MPVAVANVVLTDTFLNWINRTNQIATAMRDVVVTVGPTPNNGGVSFGGTVQNVAPINTPLLSVGQTGAGAVGTPVLHVSQTSNTVYRLSGWNGTSFEGGLDLQFPAGVSINGQAVFTANTQLALGTTAASGRAALSLGTAATANTGTSGTSVPLLSGVNTFGGTQTFAGGARTTGNVATFEWEETDATPGSRRWMSRASNAAWELLVVSDDGLTTAPAFRVTRSGAALSGVDVPTFTIAGNVAWHANNQPRIEFGTTTGQVPLWDAVLGRYVPGTVAAGGTNVPDGNRGDINVTSAGSTWTVNAGAITYAKIQNVSADVLLGRGTGLAGSIQEIACTTFARSLLDDVDAVAARATLGLGGIATLGSINNTNWSGAALAVNNGGTGIVSYTSGNYVRAASASSLEQRTPAQVLADIGAATSTHTHGDATPGVSGFMPAADKTKLDGIAAGATANATDAQLRDRATHTGTQGVATITMNTARMLGRSTAGVGSVEEIAIGSGLLLSSGVLSSTAGGSGTVTSVGVSVGMGMTGGGTVTTSGTINIGLNANLQNWADASIGSFSQVGHAHDTSHITSGIFDVSRIPVALSGTSSPTQVVRADDSRLSDARPPIAHTHDASSITSGTLAVARGGTGTTSSTGSGSVVLSTSPSFAGTASFATIVASGDITGNSDARLKIIERDCYLELNQMADVRAVDFSMIGSGRRSSGVVAQDLAAILPRLVVAGEDGLLSVAYGNAGVVLALNLARELASERRRNDDLERRLIAIESRRGA